MSGIVVTVTNDITSKSAFTLTAIGLYQVELSFFKTNILLPNVRVLLLTRGKNLRYDMLE